MNRETYLTRATEALNESVFSGRIPGNIRVSCGFPSKSATSAKKRSVGECWDPSVSTDQVSEIFISPVLSEPLEVLGTLAHELVHATVGTKCGHRGAFKKLALEIGLTGKMTSTVPGPELTERLNALSEKLGPYPHAGMNIAKGLPKQGTRLLKAECPCGGVIRITKGQVEERGLPICGSCQENFELTV